MINQQPFSRHLKIPGCLNLRELGGYQTTNGKYIKPRTLLRSDSLHRLPVSSQQQLIDYGIKTIIDLRSSLEVAKEAYLLSNRTEIEYFNLPLVHENKRNIIESIKDKTLLELNIHLLQERANSIKTILETVATKQAPILIHCAVGKDRTGIISALLLAIAGVSVETIAQDYNLSDVHLASLYDQMRPQAVRENFTHLLESPPQTMIDTFSYLKLHYGGIKGYATNIGLDSHLYQRLQTMLVQA